MKQSLADLGLCAMVEVELFVKCVSDVLTVLVMLLFVAICKHSSHKRATYTVENCAIPGSKPTLTVWTLYHIESTAQSCVLRILCDETSVVMSGDKSITGAYHENPITE